MENLEIKSILHYKILKKLGEGGMGIVYEAEDTKLKRIVAIKFLPRFISANKEERQRFETEAQAAASLNHPNISTIHSIEEADDRIFIVMEFIDGIELKDKIKNGSVQIDKAVDIAVQIADGLKAAHKKEIIHRDIKSANIMITEDGIVKIMDFGLAKIKGGTDVTKIHTTVGTAAYMSPEQARGEILDRRTDIWSFGIVLYEMLFGQLPFKGEYEQAIVYGILNDEPEFADIPVELNHILSKALAKSPKDRYQNVNEMLDDLKTFKGVTASKSFSSKTVIKKPERKSKVKLILAAASFLIIAVVAAVYFLINTNTKAVESATARKMIVVFPFENLGSQDDNYFANGVTDEITSKLSSIADIGVLSSKSAEKLAKANKSNQEIGKEFGVNYILEGKIRWAKDNGNKNRVIITPQLTRVSDNTITWSESYDRVLDDIFAVQNEIAQKVVDQLSGSLNAGQMKKIVRPTDNLEAYDLYLRGLAYDNRGTYLKDDIQNSISLFSKAVVLDPKFASAYAYLSRSKSEMYWFFYDRTKNNVKEAYDNVQKAVELNPDLAETHLSLGYYYYWCELKYDSAIKEFSKVLEIQPNNAEAVYGLGLVYRRMGNFNLALQNQLKGLSLDPLSVEYSHNVAETYGLLRDYSNSEKYFKRVIELNPDLNFPKAGLAMNYIDWKGDTKAAEDIVNEIKSYDYLQTSFNIQVYLDMINRNYDKAIKEMNSSHHEFEVGQFRFTPRTQELGLIYKLENQPALSKLYFDSSRIQLEKMIKDNPQDERLHSSLGKTYAALGNKEKAIYEGKKGIELLPIEKEAYRGYFRLWDLADIYTLLGDYDNALKQIDFILSIPGTFSINQLKLFALFDPLRNLPGYKAIIEKYSVKN
jgi:non-specific serine/threonine protein kinase